MRYAVVALLLTLPACGGEMGPCKDRSGTYLVTMTPRSGDCGTEPAEGVVVVDDTTDVSACTGTRKVSDSNCTVRLSGWQCPGEGRFTGDVVWSEDGDEGDGIVQVELSSCFGTFDVTYRRP